MNGIEKFTHKIAKLLLEKLHFSSQMRHQYNPDDFVKWRIVYRIKMESPSTKKSFYEHKWHVHYLKNNEFSYEFWKKGNQFDVTVY